MGVPKLTSLVNRKNICRDQFFGSGPLVIDGSNLVYHLYFDSGLDQNRGGEYGAFEDLVKQFIKALRDCGISPYVIFDGCSDLSDQKWETEIERAQQRVQKAHAAAVKNQRMGVLPTLIWEAFRQTLVSLDVPIARSYTEADREAAALAQEWGCPVLSNDSDFFIFPMSGGMLPTAHFRWQEVQQSGSHISCKKYLSSSFCQVFGINPQLLPVFAILAGNDYVRNPVGQQERATLEGILQWIRNLNVSEPRDVFMAALKDVSVEQREEQLKGLLQAAQNYSLPNSSLSRFFSKTHTLPPLPGNMVDVVPDWMRRPVTEARFSSDFLDVLTTQRVGLSVVVDHKDKASANLVSRPLREVMYALLLGRDSSRTVVERDRDGLQVQYTRVTLASTIPPELNILSLHQTEEPQRLQVLLDALGVNEDRLSSLPPHLSHLKLPLAATCYWLQQATPPPHLLEALLIGWCQGDIKAAQDPDLKRAWDLDWCHSLNQWQSCLRDSFLLNQLLGRPLPEPTIARLYNGTLVYVLLHKMKCGQLDRFVQCDIRSDKDYCTLLAITQNRAAGPARGTSAAQGLTSHQRPSSSPQKHEAVAQKKRRKF